MTAGITVKEGKTKQTLVLVSKRGEKSFMGLTEDGSISQYSWSSFNNKARSRAKPT